MTVDDPDDFGYAEVVIETLREAGGPISNDELWDRVMRRSDVPADDRESYWTPPYKPGPYPRNIVKLKLTTSLMLHTDLRGRRPNAPLWTTEEGYWLPDWGPLPIIEQQRRAELADEQARRQSEPSPKVWPELDPYSKTSKASEAELRVVAEKLVSFRSLVSGQRMVTMTSSTMSRVIHKRLEEDGTLDESRRYGEMREKKINLLMEWYGNAVRRTDGADPQDLFVLANLGLIRDPEKTAPPTQHAPTRDASSRTKQTGGGCYVATCVYGDYDAPPVMVLRKWRDQVLSDSHLGRGFIRFYYAVSPRLVRAVGNRRWFRIPARFALDRLVRRLDS